MNNTLTIARREFRAYFNSPSAYIVGCLFLLVVSFFFWAGFFLEARASMRRMFDLAYVVSVFVAPAIAMGTIAEEKRTGTMEILITMPVRDAEVVIGKFLGALSLYAVLVALTIPQVLTVSSLGDLDWGPVLTGYMGLLLCGGALLAISVMASSWTGNQLVALMLGMGLCVSFWIIGNLLVFLPTSAASVLEWLSFGYHLDSMLRGVMDTRNITFFLSVTALALALSFRSLESRRWK